MKITDKTQKAVQLGSLVRGEIFIDPIENEVLIKTDQATVSQNGSPQIRCVSLSSGAIKTLLANDSVLTVNAELIIT